jgi:serine/threonine-protein kinase
LRQEGWRPTPAEATLIVRRVADALAYAHSKGVVHCDVKPANIFMVGRTQPRVLDFGIARIAHQHEAGNSGGLAAGSPYYMAPEQVRHQTVDRRSDVFSLGVVFYELLTDVKPFRGMSLSEITDAVLDHQPPLASEVDPAVPQELAEIAARAMQKDPEHRFRSSRAFSRELRHWLEEHSIASEGSGVGSAVKNPARRLRAAALAAALAVASVGLWTWKSQRPVAVPESAAAPAANIVTAGASVPSTAPTQVAAGAEEIDVATPTPPATAVRPAPAEKSSIPERATKAAVIGPRESPKDKRAREAREREAKAPVAPTAPTATGVVRIAISPWGHVDVDGARAGTTPPLNELTLAEGKHQIVVRNEDFPPYSATVTVSPGQVVTLKYKFGS